MASKKRIKCRNMMYEQQLAYLPEGMSATDIYRHIENKLRPKRFAGIVHDQDLKPDGKTKKADHVHVMLQFENERSINQVAKEIGDKQQYIEKWDDRPENGFGYLIHATSNARHKHQYSADQVVANFNYVDEIERIAKKVAKVEGYTATNKTNALLDLVARGEVTLAEAKDQLRGSDYAKVDRKLDSVHSLFLERQAKRLHEEMKDNNEIVVVNWLYGATETGKTLLAKTLAENLGGGYYITTTLKDPFQFYQAEPTIVLDELRPEAIAYSEILAMFDPFSYGNVRMSSRYHNKALACRTFFVTTPYSPKEFYESAVTGRQRHIDKPDQLFRRLTSVLEMTDDHI